MARITVEDCLPHVANPFDLAMLAAERARQLSEGAPPAPGGDGHKPAVAALREIATGEVNLRALRVAAIERRQRALVLGEAPAADTPEPPPGDGFERKNEAAIAAGLEPLPVAGTARDEPFDDGGEGEAGHAA